MKSLLLVGLGLSLVAKVPYTDPSLTPKKPILDDQGQLISNDEGETLYLSMTGDKLWVKETTEPKVDKYGNKIDRNTLGLEPILDENGQLINNANQETLYLTGDGQKIWVYTVNGKAEQEQTESIYAENAGGDVDSNDSH